MTITLLLIRHATALPSRGEPDEDRPLSPKGLREARAMGRWIAERNLVPDEAICSAARRTRETLEGLMEGWPTAPRVAHEDRLYAAGPEAALALLGRAEGARVALVGHNPTVGVLAQRLAATAPDHLRFRDYPPGSVTVLRFDAEAWGDVARGEVLAFATPGDLS